MKKKEGKEIRREREKWKDNYKKNRKEQKIRNTAECKSGKQRRGSRRKNDGKM